MEYGRTKDGRRAPCGQFYFTAPALASGFIICAADAGRMEGKEKEEGKAGDVFAWTAYPTRVVYCRLIWCSGFPTIHVFVFLLGFCLKNLSSEWTSALITFDR